MINKTFIVDEYSIDYVITSSKEEIFINVFFDDNFVIQLTNIAIIANEDKDDIYHGVKTLESKEYIGTLGYFVAMNSVCGYMYNNRDTKGYLDSDIAGIGIESAKDIASLRKDAYDNIDEKSRKGRKQKELLNRIYGGRIDD